jgi:hypothetical protein
MAFKHTLCPGLTVIQITTLPPTNFRENFYINKSGTQKLDTHRFNLRKLNTVESNEYHQVKMSKKFAALENLHNDLDINRD